MCCVFVHEMEIGTNVVFRREHTPPDGKVQRSQSNVGSLQNRRSRLLERNCEYGIAVTLLVLFKLMLCILTANLDTLTRQSIKGTPAVC